MAAFWTWVFLISAAVHALGLGVPLLLAAPIRFTSYIPGTYVLQDTPKRYQLIPKNTEHEANLEDYKPFDPPPDADKVKPSPIENVENAPLLDTTKLKQDMRFNPRLH